MPYQLEVIEKNNIQKILNLLWFLKNQNSIYNHITTSKGLILNSISIAEKIIYTFVYYSKINQHTIYTICENLNSAKNILVQPYDINITIELYNAFNNLYAKSGNSMRGCWVINVLKSLIDEKKLLRNTNYFQCIINITTFEIFTIIQQLQYQEFLLKYCNKKEFNNDVYQYIINTYKNLKKNINNLNKDILSKNNHLLKKTTMMNEIYARTNYLYKSIKLLDDLNLCNKFIFDAYNNIGYPNSTINSQNYIMANKNYIKQLKKLALNTHYQLLSINPNQNYISLMQNKLKFFNHYYEQFQIIFDIESFHMQLKKKLIFLTNNKHSCLNQQAYDVFTNQYYSLFPKIKALHQKMYASISQKIHEIQKTFQEIYTIYYKRSDQYSLLDFQQENFVHLYFKYNPESNKISKKINHLDLENQDIEIINILKKHNNILPLGYSVIKSLENNELFAVLPSKKTNVVLRNASIKTVNGLLGIGTYGKVKLAQSLSDYSTVAVKIQKRQKNKLKHYQEIKNEERIQSILHYFIASSMVISNANKNVKYYTFSKLINGVRLLDYLQENPGLSMTEIIKILIKILYKLDFLHNKMNIVHGDLNLLNILYDPETKSLEIIDFGFSGLADQNGIIPFPSLENRTKYYIPKECYTMQIATFTSDIYNIGYWIKWYINNDTFYKYQSQKYPELLQNFINIVDKMLDDNYNLRITCYNCIQELEILLNKIKNYTQLKLTYNT